MAATVLNVEAVAVFMQLKSAERLRARYLDFVWPPTSNASMQAWAEEQSKPKMEHDAFHWVIENHKGEPVGSISTHDWNPRRRTFRYGIDIGPEHQRKGYAWEGIQWVLEYYFDGLHHQKVTAPVHSDNEPSLRMGDVHPAHAFSEQCGQAGRFPGPSQIRQKGCMSSGLPASALRSNHIGWPF